MSEYRRLGRLGESFAAELLRIEGYRIVERNYTCRAGEIDIVAERGETLCFIEVKTRRSSSFGTPAESVDRRKQNRLRRAAACYLQSRGWQGEEIAFQVVEITVSHIRDAF